jgi:hypothetical protein
MFLGLQDPDPDPLVRGTDSDPDPSLFGNNGCKLGFQHKILAIDKFLRLKIMCLWVSYIKKWGKKVFLVLKSLKKGVGSGSGSISQRCGSGSAQNVTDPQHC